MQSSRRENDIISLQLCTLSRPNSAEPLQLPLLQVRGLGLFMCNVCEVSRFCIAHGPPDGYLKSTKMLGVNVKLPYEKGCQGRGFNKVVTIDYNIFRQNC